MRLPAYTPPSARGCWIALLVSPALALGAWLLVDSQAIGMDAGLAALVACIVWVAAELHAHQSAQADYDDDYAQAHLSWRATPTLQALAGPTLTDDQTGAFVHGWLAGQGLAADPEIPTEAR